MSIPQSGIFALGTASHAYLEIEARSQPRTTMGGVNLVAGFRPELWSEVAPEDSPSGVHGFNADLIGVDGYVMHATQHDACCGSPGALTT